MWRGKECDLKEQEKWNLKIGKMDITCVVFVRNNSSSTDRPKSLAAINKDEPHVDGRENGLRCGRASAIEVIVYQVLVSSSAWLLSCFRNPQQSKYRRKILPLNIPVLDCFPCSCGVDLDQMQVIFIERRSC